jgi:hypothetical protein
VGSLVAAAASVGVAVEFPSVELTAVPKGTSVGVGRAVGDLVGVGDEVNSAVGLGADVEVARATSPLFPSPGLRMSTTPTRMRPTKIVPNRMINGMANLRFASISRIP